MKAIRVEQFGGPEVLRMEEIPTPRAEGAQLVVRIRAAGVNPVDTYIRAGAYSAKPALPYTPGGDGAGIVEMAGPAAPFKPGDRVYLVGSVTGTYAEFALCDPAQVHRLPDHVNFSQGAAIGAPYGAAYRALIQRARALPGETVLIHGASGGAGTAAVQIARAHGMRVLGTAGTEEGRRMVLEQGAHGVFDHGAPDYMEQIKQAVEGRGVDVIVEMLANVNLSRDLKLLGLHGRVIVVGSRGRIEIDPRDTMNQEADIRGTLLSKATAQERERIYCALSADLESSVLRPVIAREMPLAESPMAHIAVMKSGAMGKIVLLP